METLDFILNGGETRRFHTWPVLREQRVDGHSWGVAMICALIAQDEDIGIGVPLLMAALSHDLAEHKFGDMPAPAKRGLEAVFPDFRAQYGKMENQLLVDLNLDWEGFLGERELRILKIADAMEGALYCIRERAMGNKLMGAPFANFRNYIRDVLGEHEPTPAEAQIIQYIDDMWEQAND